MMRAHNFGGSRGFAALQRSQAYTSPEDFCTIFRDDSDSLYSLALLLTGNHEVAQTSFATALEDCRTGNNVFPEWARSWSRRAIIKSAIRLLPPLQSGVEQPGLNTIAGEMHPSARPLLQLDRFDRFVLVISVLEGYSVRECAALLGASSREVEQARVRALQQIAAGNDNIVPQSFVNNSQGAANVDFRAASGRNPNLHTSFTR